MGDLVSSHWDGLQALNSTQAAQIDLGPDWQELGSADFTGDGTDDVLFRNVNTHEVGFVDGAGDGSVQTLGTMDDDWSVTTLSGVPQGLLDFYQDEVHGIANVVWHNAATGAVSIWHVVDGELKQTLDMPQGGYWGIAAADTTSASPSASAGLGTPGTFDIPTPPPSDVAPGFAGDEGDSPPDVFPDPHGLPGIPPGATSGGLGGHAGESAAAGLGSLSNSLSGISGGIQAATTDVPTQAADTLALGPEWQDLGSADFNGDGVADTLVRNTDTHEVGFVPGGQGEDAPVEPLGTIEDGFRVAKLAAVSDDLLSFDHLAGIESLAYIAWQNEATGAVSIWQIQNGALEQTLDVPAGGYWGIAGADAAPNDTAVPPVTPGLGDWHLSGLA